ncbi:MAG: hypothetical protein R3D30_00020 [Hyphomicrobiales bacterium]
MMRRIVLIVLGVFLLAASPARAQGLPEPNPAWTFDGGFYAWALWVQGDATARGEEFDVYADPIDLIDALDGPIIMANLSGARGRFSFYADIVYAEFGLDSDFVSEAHPIPQLTLKGDARIGADYTFGVYQADAFYQIANFAGAKGNTTVDLGAGVRVVEQDLKITAALDLNAKIELGRFLDRLENRINRINNQAQRAAALAQFNALRADLLKQRIIRADDRGLQRRVARLEGRLKRVDNRGEAIAALQALDKFRLALLQRALNLNNTDIHGNLAFVDTGTMDWVDPVIALRMTHDLGNGESITAMGDFGGFNVDDGLSAQVILAYNRDGTLFGFETTTTIGYKALWLNFEDNTPHGARGVNVWLHGPLAEISFRW